MTLDRRREQVILALENGFNTNVEIASCLDVHRITAGIYLREMVRDGLIKETGKKPGPIGGRRIVVYGLLHEDDLPAKEAPPLIRKRRCQDKIPAHTDLMAAFYGLPAVT